MRLYTQECLSVHQVRANQKENVLTAVLIQKGLAEAKSRREELYREYEKFYPTEYPNKVVFVYLNSVRTSDNYKAVSEWLASRLSGVEVNAESNILEYTPNDG